MSTTPLYKWMASHNFWTADRLFIRLLPPYGLEISGWSLTIDWTEVEEWMV